MTKMTEYRSAAESFVIEFLRYVQKHDILDEFNKRTQKMERSPGIAAIIKQAQSVFPPEVEDGKKETDKLTKEQVDEAIEASPDVLDTRELFGRKIAENGAARGLLEKVLAGDVAAIEQANEFLQAERGEKKFREDESKSVS